MGRLRSQPCSQSCASAPWFTPPALLKIPSGKKEGASAQIANYTRKKTIITRALLGSDAGLYGAARLPAS
jgi:hypothetical protein